MSFKGAITTFFVAAFAVCGWCALDDVKKAEKPKQR